MPRNAEKSLCCELVGRVSVRRVGQFGGEDSLGKFLCGSAALTMRDALQGTCDLLADRQVDGAGAWQDSLSTKSEMAAYVVPAAARLSGKVASPR